MAILGFLVPNVPYLALVALTLAIVGTMSAIPVFWQMPNQFLAGSAAAAGIALINSVANLAGFGAPYAMGVIEDMTVRCRSVCGWSPRSRPRPSS